MAYQTPPESAKLFDPNAVKVVEEQLKASIETFRFLFDLMVKVWAFLIAASGVVFGFGIISRASGPIFCSALITGLATILPMVLNRSLIPIAYSAYVAEKSLRPHHFGIVQIFGLTLFSSIIIAFEEISQGPGEEVPTRLRALARKPRFIGVSITVIIGFASVVQALIAFYFLVVGAPLFALE